MALDYCSVFPAAADDQTYVIDDSVPAAEIARLLAGSVYDEVPATLLFAQRIDLERAVRRAGPSSPVGRVLQVCGRLTSSRHVVVLTEALSRKYDLPLGMDPASIHAWRAQLGTDEDFELYDLATDGFVEPVGDLRRTMSSEASIVRTLRRRGTDVEARRFLAAETIHTLWDAAMATDPARRDESRTDGTVFATTVVDADRGRVRLRSAVPFKARVGKSVTILGERAAGVDKDRSHRVSQIRAGRRGEFFIDLAVRDPSAFEIDQELDLAVTAFASRSVHVELGRWAGIF